VRLRAQHKRPAAERIRLLERYRWSSLAGYWDSKNKQGFVTYESVLEQIGHSRKRYREFILDGINSGYATPWDSVEGQVVLGAEKFIERIKEELEENGSQREQPGVRRLKAKAPAGVVKVVARFFGVEEERLTGKRTGLRDQRAVAMELMYRHGGIGQVEIGRLIGGLDYTAVSRERKRLREKLERDASLRRAMEQIDTQLMSKVKI